MASNINVAAVSGNLTRDAELRMTQAGTAVLEFGVATNDSVRDPQTDQYTDKPNYIDCVLFGQRAQAIAPYLRKGTFVVVQGSLSWSSWQDKETGKNRSKIEVRVREVNFPMQMQPQQPAQPQAYAPQQPAQPYRQPAPQAYAPQQPAQAYQPPYQQQAAPQAYRQPAPQPAPQQPAQQQLPMQQPAPQQTPPVDVYDEDIPF